MCNGVKSIPAELLSSWVNNKRLAGGQCTTVKRTIAKHLRLLYGENIVDIVGNTTITFMDNCGSFKYWLKDACNKPYWEKLIESKLVHPDRDIPLPSRASTSSSSHTPANSKEAATGDRKRLSMVNMIVTIRLSARHYLWVLTRPKLPDQQ